uniref:Uncharacterized protein n=1 Tax=Salix viminalis TaxID=40686 RepID=A0A6N2KDP3_SALVM
MKLIYLISGKYRLLSFTLCRLTSPLACDLTSSLASSVPLCRLSPLSVPISSLACNPSHLSPLSLKPSSSLASVPLCPLVSRLSLSLSPSKDRVFPLGKGK